MDIVEDSTHETDEVAAKSVCKDILGNGIRCFKIWQCQKR